MRRGWYSVFGVALCAAALGGGVVSASNQAASSGPSGTSHSLLSRAQDGVDSLTGLVGFDDETPVAPGTLDDGKDLLPQARISLDDAIAAATGATSGALGEVDLEDYQGHLVFNIDVGDQDVKIDALDGAVIGSVPGE